MPELVYEAQDQVPEAIKAIAVEKDGKWVANVVPKAELDDFRNRNIEISRKSDTLTGLVGRLTTDVGFDPEKVDDFVTSFAELKTIKQQVDDGKLVADSSLNEAVEAKTGEMKRTFEQTIHGLKTENGNFKGQVDTLTSKLNRSIVDREVMMAVNDPKSGALPEATKQILREAYDTFTVGENDTLVPKDPQGNIIYGSDGATPMKPLEWLKHLEEQSPFFFKSAQGGGGGGGSQQAGGLTPAAIAAMTPEQKMDYGRQHGLNKS